MLYSVAMRRNALFRPFVGAENRTLGGENSAVRTSLRPGLLIGLPDGSPTGAW